VWHLRRGNLGSEEDGGSKYEKNDYEHSWILLYGQWLQAVGPLLPTVTVVDEYVSVLLRTKIPPTKMSCESISLTFEGIGWLLIRASVSTNSQPATSRFPRMSAR